MGRYRSRSRSYSPRRRSRSPPAPRGRKRYVDDRYGDSRSYRDRRSPLPSGLLVRNLPLDARPEDLRIPFERYGPVKDVYLPKNYYTGEPRGFGFVKYRYGEDAAEAKQHLNHTIIGGREIRIVFAEENRKTPQEMRVNTRGSGRHGGGRRRNRTRSPRPRSYSRSPSPARDDSRYEHNK
ncbi:Serine/arginine-rich SC35-like splicing factor SCL28 isoform B [Glycine soja]|uniref:Serine/arginine-rich SC35-like splicing factor SCL28 isoform B n=1 Tax=Glycine soja TaxID=3848 RepID=A0A445K1U2_GLYSO|nr:Serine/arginine-rich SC35-like splicing factor SCL28 isoform B [Glycine soja]